MKCLTPFFLGDFALSGHTLKNQGMNRTGNLLVPNYNYAKFEEWIMPIMDQMLLEQKTQVGSCKSALETPHTEKYLNVTKFHVYVIA